MNRYARILQYLRDYQGKLVLYVICTLLATVFSLLSLGFLSPFMDLIFKGEPAQQAALNSNAIGSTLKNYLTEQIRENGKIFGLGLICIFIVVSTVIKNFFLYTSYYISSPIRSAVITRLRGELYSKILVLPIGYFTEQRKGDIISRMTNDVTEVEISVVSTMEGLIKDPLTILAHLLFLVYLSPTLSLFLLVLLPLTGFIIGRISRNLKKQSQTAAILLGDSLSILDETLAGLRVIKAFLAERILLNKFIDINQHLFRVRKQMHARRDLASPLTELLGVIVLSIILYFGGRLALTNNGGLPAGDLIAYIAVFAMIINPAKNLSTAFFNIQRGSAAIQRIEEILQAPLSIEEKAVTKSLDRFDDSIEFRNVSFGYDGVTILDNINLKIEKGKMIALVGSSGAGKSTLADLVPRFHDSTSGELLIDGVNIREYSLQSLRQHMGIVTQEPILFNDTIANNISLGSPGANIAEIEQAAIVANAHQFIMNKDENYQTNIGDRGNKLSGGEKQRLTIARAVLKNPPILILDEATSSLDTESEKLVQDAINNMMQNRTSIVIAHRLSTIRHADEIIVLQKGKIVERGTHDELIRHDGYYKRLVYMQEVK